MPDYIGTATGNTGIPTLLISSLNKIKDKDPDIHTALYQIQNWANSFHTLLNVLGVGPAYVGSPPAAGVGLAIETGVFIGTTGVSGTFTVNFPTAFPGGIFGVWGINAQNGGNHFWLETDTVLTSAVSFQCMTSSTTNLGAGVAVTVPWLALGW